jgi:hypothetical protein
MELNDVFGFGMPKDFSKTHPPSMGMSGMGMVTSNDDESDAPSDISESEYESDCKSVSHAPRPKFQEDLSAADMSDACRSVSSSRSSNGRARRKRVIGVRTRSSNKAIDSGLFSYGMSQKDTNNEDEDSELEDDSMLFGGEQEHTRSKPARRPKVERKTEKRVDRPTISTEQSDRALDRAKLRDRMRRERGTTSPTKERTGDKEPKERSVRRERSMIVNPSSGSPKRERSVRRERSICNPSSTSSRSMNNGSSSPKPERERSVRRERSFEKEGSVRRERSFDKGGLEKEGLTEKERAAAERERFSEKRRGNNTANANATANATDKERESSNHKRSTRESSDHKRSTQRMDSNGSQEKESTSSSSQPKGRERARSMRVNPTQQKKLSSRALSNRKMETETATRRENSKRDLAPPSSPFKQSKLSASPSSPPKQSKLSASPSSPTKQSKLSPASPSADPLPSSPVKQSKLSASASAPADPLSPGEFSRKSPVRRMSSKRRVKTMSSPKPTEYASPKPDHQDKEEKKEEKSPRPLGILLRRPSLNSLKGEQSPRSLTEAENSWADEASRASTYQSGCTEDSDDDSDDNTVLQFDPTQSDNVSRVRQVQKEDSTYNIKNGDGKCITGHITELDDPLSEAHLASQPKQDTPVFDLLGSDPNFGFDADSFDPPADGMMPLGGEEEEEDDEEEEESSGGGFGIDAPSGGEEAYAPRSVSPPSGDEEEEENGPTSSGNGNADTWNDSFVQAPSGDEEEVDFPPQSFTPPQTFAPPEPKATRVRRIPGRSKSFDACDKNFENAEDKASRLQTKRVRRKRPDANFAGHSSAGDLNAPSLDAPSDSELDSPQKPRRRLKKKGPNLNPPLNGDEPAISQIKRKPTMKPKRPDGPDSQPLGPASPGDLSQGLSAANFNAPPKVTTDDKGGEGGTDVELSPGQEKIPKRISMGSAIGRYFGRGASRRNSGNPTDGEESDGGSLCSSVHGRGRRGRGAKKHLLLGDSDSSLDSGGAPF